MIKWPQDKIFAFTIVDDTDKATVDKIKPVYDYLYKSGLLATKTVWALPSRDELGGESLTDEHYEKFIKDIASKGFEIASHGAGSGNYTRNEILYALEKIKETVGYYPKMHINHAWNEDNLYWNSKRFIFPLNIIYMIVKKIIGEKCIVSLGDVRDSKSFWGDFSKKKIKYIRNRVFSDLNTLNCDKFTPYKEKSKEEYTNYWFSSSDGYDCNTFIKLLTKENIDRLEKENGYAIVYTHFAYGFVNDDGELNEEFKKCIDYLSSKNSWFVPASELLDYINSIRKKDKYLNNIQALGLDLKWFIERIKRKIFLGV